MRLNVGCGDHRAEGWVNLDSFPGVGPDIVGTLTDLPVRSASVVRLYAGHVLEHVPHDMLEEVAGELRRVLCAAGRLCVVGPDYHRAVATGDDVLVQVVRDGGHRWPGDEHRWLPTEAAHLEPLRAVFADAAPIDVADLAGTDWPVVSHVGWQFAIVATNR